MNPYLKLFPCLIFISSFLCIHSQYSLIKAKNVESFCSKSVYNVIIDIEINNPLQEYKSFYFYATSVKDLLFKCILDPQKLKIFCKTNLHQQRVNLKATDQITLPYPFPEVPGIAWEYNSFINMVFRRTIYLNEECSDSSIRFVSKLNLEAWDIIAKINKIYDGECLLSDTKDNFYSFKMNFEIIEGNLFHSLEKASKDKIGTEITLMQNITMPFLIGPLQSLIRTHMPYQTHEYYKTAFCHPMNNMNINSTNYYKEGGIDFHCDIPISDQYIFNGPLKIRSFSDYIYAEVSSGSEDDVIDFISIFFTTEKNPTFNPNNEFEGEEKQDNNNDDDDDDFEEEEEKANEKNDKFNSENNEDDNKEKEKEKENKEEEKNKANVINKEAPNNSNVILNKPSSSSSSKSLSSSAKTLSSSAKTLSSSAKTLSSSAKTLSSSAKTLSSSAKTLSSSTQAPSPSKSAPQISAQSSTVSSKSSSPSNLRSLQKEENKKKTEYLFLDNLKTNFICPDKPVFEIVNIEKGIVYEPILEKNDKYNIILTGYLKNGYKIVDKKIVSLEYTPNEIKFNLSITNNLVEETTEKKNNLLCSLSAGTMFLDKETATIRCTGNKIEQKKFDNTDITVNWASKENKYLNNIVIKWPKYLTVHSKKLYSYKINALSINNMDYDCYDDKYYFYINILDISSEPEISFEIDMLNPQSMKAFCRLYTSSLLKCYIDLRLKKIKKGTRIRILLPGNYNISTVEGNYINFTVLSLTDGNRTDFADEGIIADETCGNNMIVGAIQDIGYGYGTAITIIIIFFAVFFVVFLGIGYCVIYEITHRNKKKDYFAHVEERTNTSTTNQSVSPISGQPNIIPK
jgi:hypothetical protein